MKAETYFTANMGYGKAKKRIVHAFWNALWPLLSQGGWSKVRDNGIFMYFIFPH
jgi:hypothetical protein